MDDARFDRWTQELGAQRTRRGLGALALGALAAVGLAEGADVKGKKGKKKKKKKGQVQIPPPASSPPPPPARTCLPQGSRCTKDVDTCCSSTVSSVNPICSRVGSEITFCCFPTGTRFPDLIGTVNCCGGGWKPDDPNNFYDGPGACCIGNDVALVPGDIPEQCCTGPHTYQGRCALPPGHTCYQDSFSLCWNGSRCNGQRCPDA